MSKNKFNYLSSNRKRLHAVFYILKDKKILDVVLKYLKYCTDKDFIDAIQFLSENKYFHLEENQDIYFHALSDKASNIYIDYITYKTCNEILTLNKTDYYQLIKEFIYDEIVNYIKNTNNESKSNYDFVLSIRNVINDLERDFNNIENKNKSSSFCLNNPEEVEKKLINVVKNNITPSTFKTFNYITNGGFKRGTLNILMGGTGSHKTTYLCNLALSLWLNGYNVVYITLEIYGEEILKRLIANVAETKINEIDFLIKNNKDFLENAKKLFMDKKNTFKIYELPSGTTTNNDIQKIVEDEYINENKIDVLVIDYINLLTTNNNDGNSFKILKDVSEGLRVLSRINDLVVITATQINRLGLNSDKPTLKDISESYGMATYADFIAAICYNRQTPNSISLVPLKNRYGHLVDVKIPMEIKGEYMKIYDYISKENFKNFYNVNTDIVDKIVEDALNEQKTHNVYENKISIKECENFSDLESNFNFKEKESNQIENNLTEDLIEENSLHDIINESPSNEVGIIIEEENINISKTNESKNYNDFNNELIYDENHNVSNSGNLNKDENNTSEYSNNDIELNNDSNNVFSDEIKEHNLEIYKFKDLFNCLSKVIYKFDENITNFIEISKKENFNSPYLNRIKLNIDNLIDLLNKNNFNTKDDLEHFYDIMINFVDEIQESLSFVLNRTERIDFKERKFDNFCFYQIHSCYDYLINFMKNIGYPIKIKKYIFSSLTNNYDSSKKIIKFQDFSNKERVIFVYNDNKLDEFKFGDNLKSNIKTVYKYLYSEQSDINNFPELENFLEHDYNLMVGLLTENNLISFYKNIESKLNECLFGNNFWACLVNWIRLEIIYNNKAYIDFNNLTPFSKVLYEFVEHNLKQTLFKDHLNYNNLTKDLENINKNKKNKKGKPKGFKD